MLGKSGRAQPTGESDENKPSSLVGALPHVRPRTDPEPYAASSAAAETGGSPRRCSTAYPGALRTCGNTAAWPTGRQPRGFLQPAAQPARVHVQRQGKRCRERAAQAGCRTGAGRRPHNGRDPDSDDHAGAGERSFCRPEKGPGGPGAGGQEARSQRDRSGRRRHPQADRRALVRRPRQHAPVPARSQPRRSRGDQKRVPGSLSGLARQRARGPAQGQGQGRV